MIPVLARERCFPDFSILTKALPRNFLFALVPLSGRPVRRDRGLYVSLTIIHMPVHHRYQIDPIPAFHFPVRHEPGSNEEPRTSLSSR